MNTSIFHSVNSGLYFWDGTTGLLVDGIHTGQEDGFSPMPVFLAEQMAHRAGLFAHVDGLLFTHQHRDHFQREGLHHFLHGPFPPAVYGPALPESSAVICPVQPGMYWVQLAGAVVLARDTLHDGTRYRNDPHQAYLIHMENETFFVGGDAILTAEDAHAFVGSCSGEVEAGFFNLYQLSSPEGQEFLRILRPKRVFLVHLPFREDDIFSYCSLARQTVKHMLPDLPKTEILSHMSWVDGQAAQWSLQEEGEKIYALSGITQH